MPTKTEPKRMQDVLVWETNPNYCRKLRTFRHSVGSTTSFDPGLVTEVSAAKEIPVATAGNAAGILLQTVKDLATATDLNNVLFLKKGPALVNYDQLNFNGVVAATAWAALNVLLIDGYTQPTQTTSMPA
jgi:hypothetical protein